MSVAAEKIRKRRPVIPIMIGIMTAASVAAVLMSRPAGPSGEWARAPSAVQAVMWPEPRPLAEFELTTGDGRPFSRESLLGQWNFLFFGYTGCPDVCPTSLYAMRELRQRLLDEESSAENYRFIFVSVDTENDRPEDIGPYLDWYDPEFVGLTGRSEELARLAQSMAVKYAVVQDEQGARSIDHTSSVLIVDPQARMVGALPPPLRPSSMKAQFGALRGYLEE